MEPDQRTRFPLFWRITEIARLQHQLERDSFPRLQMLLIVSITGGFGFLASFVLLHSGVTQMWLRYLYAFGISYFVFLLLLWLWMRTQASDYSDIGDLSGGIPSPSSSGSEQPPFVGRGGTADGGGASGNFEASIGAGHGPDPAISFSSPSDALSAAADGDEFALPLIVIVMIAAILLSTCWIVYSAPVLFAELLLDGLLTAGLYRRIRGVALNYWWLTAIKRTFWAFLLTAMLFAASGWLMQNSYPEARTVGEFVHLRTQSQ